MRDGCREPRCCRSDRPTGRETSVAPKESSSFKGKVWIGDDGRIAAVTQGTRRAGRFSRGTVVDVGPNLVVPGLMTCTVTLPTRHFRSGPSKAAPTLAHHNTWVTRPSYPIEVTWPAYAFVEAAPAELLPTRKSAH